MEKKSGLSYEEALCELEKIINELESGDLSLEDSLNAFQRGIELSKFCSRKLDEIEKKITILIESEDGEVKETDFAGVKNDSVLEA